MYFFLHYFSFMCVIMMVFSVCVNDYVYRLYMLVFKAELWLIMTLITTSFWWLSVYYKGKKQIPILQYVAILTLYQLMKLQYINVNLS